MEIYGTNISMIRGDSQSIIVSVIDKDGNKVKVTIDGDTVKVTQAKYNQTAEFRNGKVTAVKKLTESQTEAEFK